MKVNDLVFDCDGRRIWKWNSGRAGEQGHCASATLSLSTFCINALKITMRFNFNGTFEKFPPSGNNRIAPFFLLTPPPAHSRHVAHIFWVARSASVTARLPVFPVSDATELLIRTLICRPESGNCATSPRILSSGFQKNDNHSNSKPAGVGDHCRHPSARHSSFSKTF